jgi:DNA-binding IclR family transcriptional regulator
VSRHKAGPTTLSELNSLLAEVRRRGYATEDGEVTPGLASIASAVVDHAGYPVAAVAVTFEGDREVDHSDIVQRAIRTAGALTGRLRGRSSVRLQTVIA